MPFFLRYSPISVVTFELIFDQMLASVSWALISFPDLLGVLILQIFYLFHDLGRDLVTQFLEFLSQIVALETFVHFGADAVHGGFQRVLVEFELDFGLESLKGRSVGLQFDFAFQVVDLTFQVVDVVVVILTADGTEQCSGQKHCQKFSEQVVFHSTKD